MVGTQGQGGEAQGVAVRLMMLRVGGGTRVSVSL